MSPEAAADEPKIGVVVAHYHPRGLIRDDLAALIDAVAQNAQRLMLVSTNLRQEYLARFAPNVTVLIRDNHGYDFFSYKLGIDALGDLRALRRLILMNSSFICLDQGRLMRGFFANDHAGFDAFGLTYSREHRRHLQSYLLSFGPACLRSAEFRRWWSQMVPIDERDRVITKYELGLSSYLRKSGFSLGRAYRPTIGECLAALARASRTPKRTVSPLSLSPTHFYWDFVLRDFGIAKIEMVKTDPYRLMDARSRERLLAASGAAGVE